jgi:FAD:protein FMN transferase
MTSGGNVKRIVKAMPEGVAFFFRRALPCHWAYVVLGLAMALTLWTGCKDGGSGATRPEHVHTGPTQGTSYTVKYVAEERVDQGVIEAVLKAVDDAANLWQPSSRINAVNDWTRRDSLMIFKDSTQVFSLLWARSVEMNGRSGGAFDVTVGPLVELWGFGLSKRTGVTSDQVAEALQHVGMTTDRIDVDDWEGGQVDESGDRVASWGWTYVRKRDPGVKLDMNAIAQGYTVDLIADELEMAGVEHFMVEVGGEVKCRGRNGEGRIWRIAIDKPEGNPIDGRGVEAVIAVADGAVCTSGSYRKFYELPDGSRLSHTIDPRTGYPVTHGLLSSTVHAVDAATADALATVCLVLGPEQAVFFIEDYRLRYPEERVEAFFIYDDDGGADYGYWVSEGWANRSDVLEQL